MLREVALRRALQDARDRRQAELEEIQDRSRGLRRRLRELTDRSLALGTVHGRFVPEAKTHEDVSVASPVMPEAPAPTVSSRDTTPLAPAISAPVLLPIRRDEEVHAGLLRTLRDRFPDGFTIGQMREAMEEIDGRAHSYDAAWALGNALQRTKVLEVAGVRPGERGPIRILRVARHLALPAEVS